MEKIKKKIKNKKGTTVTEFVLVLPILLISLCIIISGGQMLINKCVLNYAASEAARKACVQASLDDAREIAQSSAQKIVKEGLGMTLNNTRGDNNSGVTVYGSTWEKGYTVSVTVFGKYNTVFPLIDSDGWTNSHSPSSTKRMIIENNSENKLGY